MKRCRGLAPTTEGVLKGSASLRQIRSLNQPSLKNIFLKFRIWDMESISFRRFQYFDLNNSISEIENQNICLEQFIRSTEKCIDH